jgi:circadian clock protein KaiB
MNALFGWYSAQRKPVLLSMFHIPSLSRMPKLTYVLQVFVAGEKGRSRSAIENLKKICEKELPGQYKIEVVDVSKNPRVAVENNLTALPAVFRTLPSPVRKFVGNWANEKNELVGFELITQDKPKSASRRKASSIPKRNRPKSNARTGS